MQTKKILLFTSDAINLAVNTYLPDENKPIKAIVQIAHGMSEHANRYDQFAEFLVKKGFGVYAAHHRGHGETAGDVESTGYFADHNGWQLLVDDMVFLTSRIKELHPDIPVFLYGHSMGSIACRDYISNHGDMVNGVVLAGTTGSLGLLGAVGKLVIKSVIALKGKKHKSRFLNHLSFGTFNKEFRPNRTEFDWVSSDENEVDRYVADPFCGGIFTAKGFEDVMEGADRTNAFKSIDQIRKDLPILFICGSHDPVGKNTKGVKEVYKKYIKAGIKDLNCISYLNCRHDLLNETNRHEVYDNVSHWFEQRC